MRLFTSATKVSPAQASKQLNRYRDLVVAAKTRSLQRQALRKAVTKNSVTALTDKEYQKLIKKQTAEYLAEVKSDVSHPIDTLKRQIEMVKHNVDPNGVISKRTPLGMAVAGGALFGLPLMSGGEELKKKKNSKAERATRAAVATIPSILTPKAIPSLVAMAAPDVIFKDKKKRTVRIMGRDIPIESIREFVGRYNA